MARTVHVDSGENGRGSLEDQLGATKERIAEIAAERNRVRGDDVTPAEKRQVLADTDAEYANLLERQTSLERTISARSGRGTQTVRVNPARTTATAKPLGGDNG